MIAQILQSWTILLIAAMGGLVSERSGILNIGLEGLMTVGAFVAVAIAVSLGPVTNAVMFLSLVLAALAGVAVAGLFALFVTRFDANPFIVGLGINLLAAGSMPLLSEELFSTRGSVRVGSAVLPVAGAVILAIVVTAAMHVFLYHTATGLRLRLSGDEPRWLRNQGLSVRRNHVLGLILSGLLASLSGAVLALRLGVYIPNLTSGRGWIALVLVYLGFRKPLGLAAAGLFFGVVEALSVRAQTLANVPPTIVLGLPYILTVAAFIAYSARRKQ